MDTPVYLIQQFTNCAAVESDGLPEALMPKRALHRLYMAMQAQLAELTRIGLEQAYGVRARGDAPDLLVETGNPFHGSVFLFLTPRNEEMRKIMLTFDRDLRTAAPERIPTGVLNDRFVIQSGPMTLLCALGGITAARGMEMSERAIHHRNTILHLIERAGGAGHQYVPASALN